MKEFDYKIVQHIAVISKEAKISKELNLISFNGGKPKYDLRTWKETDDGVKMLKGMTFTDDEIKKLTNVLDSIKE